MGRLDRLERVTDLLLVLLDAPQPLSLRQIADRVPGYPEGHGARRQAFERDKRLLRDEGVPVLVVPVGGEDQLGYRIDPDAYYLPDLDLDPSETQALNLAVAGVHLGEFTGRDALSKLGVGDVPRVTGPPAPLIDLPSVAELPSLPVLFEAIRQSATVAFDYRGVRRHVDPAGIRFRRGYWYVVGFDRDRSEPRTFRVDRIDGRPVTGAPSSAALPDGFDAGDAFARDPWQYGAGEEILVDVLVDGTEAARVVAEVGSTAVVDRRPSGAVVVRLSVTDVPALITWVLGLLDHGEVLGPASVRAAMVERLTDIAGSGR
jgi:proteasome accessory factor B